MPEIIRKLLSGSGSQKTIQYESILSHEDEDLQVPIVILTTWAAGCCGANTLSHFSAYQVHSQDLVEAVLTRIRNEPVLYRRVKDLFFFFGDKHTQQEKYKFWINHPFTTRIAKYPSGSEPGHDVCLYQLTFPEDYL